MIDVGEVAMVSLEQIEVGKRDREEMGDLTEIEESIKKDGLISPLAVSAGRDGSFLLLAGERRYRILRRNKVEMIPVRIYPPNLSELQIKSIELAENFYRKDMEYWEYDNLVRKIDNLQRELHGSAAPGPGHSGHSLEDTARIVGKTKGHVSTALKRAEARETFPELFEHCKTQRDATKVLEKMDEAIITEAIARKVELDKSPSLLV